MNRVCQWLGGLVFLVCAAQTQALMLTVDANGQLVSAWGVDVDGQLLDVAFVDGACIGVFSDCNDVGDFFFQTQAGAQAAAAALLDQVLLDGPDGDFDSDSTLTNGCDFDDCFVATPYGFAGSNVETWFAYNPDGMGGETTDLLRIADFRDLTTNVNTVYAVWSISQAVPAPPAILLAALGVAGVGFFGRRRVK